MTRTRPIEPGQEFVAVQPVRSEPEPRYVRIRVVGVPQYRGYNKVTVVTVTADGSEVRRRPLEASQLHDTPTTHDGQPRKTGYVLDQSKESAT